MSKDVFEAHDLAQKMPEKVAQLNALHDARLAEMADPAKGGAKRYGLSGNEETEKYKKGKKTLRGN